MKKTTTLPERQLLEQILQELQEMRKLMELLDRQRMDQLVEEISKRQGDKEIKQEKHDT